MKRIILLLSSAVLMGCGSPSPPDVAGTYTRISVTEECVGFFWKELLLVQEGNNISLTGTHVGSESLTGTIDENGFISLSEDSAMTCNGSVEGPTLTATCSVSDEGAGDIMCDLVLENQML